MSEGHIPQTEIARRQDFVKSGAGVAVDEQIDVIVYTFERNVGSAFQVGQHIFTKEGNPAHPSLIFVSTNGERGQAPKHSFVGSYAGSHEAFKGLYSAIVLMNSQRR